jgi:pentatricopeptide repeat protein
VAETLIVGPNGVCALFPTSNLLRLEALCRERRIDEAISLVDEERRKGRRGETNMVSNNKWHAR